MGVLKLFSLPRVGNSPIKKLPWVLTGGMVRLGIDYAPLHYNKYAAYQNLSR